MAMIQRHICVFLGCVLVSISGRSLSGDRNGGSSEDEQHYNQFLIQNLPTLLQEIKELQWNRAKNIDYPALDDRAKNLDYPALDDRAKNPDYPALDDVAIDDGAWYDNSVADDVPAELRDVSGWPRGSVKVGQVGGVAMDGAGNVVVFHRADRRWDQSSFGMFNTFNAGLGPIQHDVIYTISASSGELLSHSGAGKYYMPHGLTIDGEGNMWLTDVALHQVMKIPKGSDEPSLVLGERLVPGDDDTHFCKPTDVAVASNGDFFVADGYCNSRVMKFAADGTLLAKFGSRPVNSWRYPGPTEFNIPHSLALDEGRDVLCVADRENGRIQCFSAGLNGTTAGTFINSFDPGRGTIYAIEYNPTVDKLYAVNGPGIGILEGFTLDMDGNILETWGPTQQGFGQPHDVTVSRDGADVYVGDIGKTSKVWKFTRDGRPNAAPMQMM